jgi:hypothetical protein
VPESVTANALANRINRGIVDIIADIQRAEARMKDEEERHRETGSRDSLVRYIFWKTAVQDYRHEYAEYIRLGQSTRSETCLRKQRSRSGTTGTSIRSSSRR